MSTRYEFIKARGAAVEMWTAEVVAEQAGELLRPGQRALTVAGDEVTVLVGTHEELRMLAARMTEVVNGCPRRVAVELDLFPWGRRART
jgi:hypothetical protein